MRNRVAEVIKVKASDLKANPKNWRLHPDQQRAAMQQILNEVGFVGALVAYRNAAGELMLLDGHLRQDIAGDEVVDVAVTDLTEEEANLILATYDQVGDMALVNPETLGQLLDDLEDVGDPNAELRRMIADMSRKLAKEEKAAEPEAETEREVLGMALQPHEHYDYLVVLATTSHEWNVLCDRLGLEPVKRRGGMGVARAVRASALLNVMNGGALPKKAPQPAMASEENADAGSGKKGRRK